MQKILIIIPALLTSLQSLATDIEVRGKIIQPCNITKGIKIRDYNVMGSEWKEVNIINGQFSYHYDITDPKQISVKAGSIHVDFLATAKEKVYNLEVYCDKSHGDTITIKNSDENNAFTALYFVNKTMLDKLKELANGNIGSPESFAQVKKIYKDYQSKIKALAASSPGSYTATVFIPSEVLPEESFASIDALRKNFLKRDVLSNPVYYSTYLSSRIVLAYISLRNKADKANSWITDMLQTASKNPEAARRLQQVIYDLFYARKDESLLASYALWSSSHPQQMLNPVVKAQLANIENIMAGNPYSDIELKDSKGISHKLSSDVSSSKLTLLIFYSPTCSHCQEQLPQIVPVWNKYKSKGLKIYAVGYDGTQEEWKSFMQKYNTGEWTNVWETMEMSNRPTIKYVVNVTPALILIDPSGKIIERFDELDAVLSSIRKRLD